MKAIAVVAIGAKSALGQGVAAYSVGPVGIRPTSAIREDAALREARLQKPFVARAVDSAGGVDPAETLFHDALRILVSNLDRAHQGWRKGRVAVAVGTSSGGMVPLTKALGLRAAGRPVPAELAARAPYFGPLASLGDVLGVEPELVVQVLAACSSSGFAIGLGARWLDLGHADLVIAGGYDAVSPFVAAGFESIGATSARHMSPFRAGRDGMALGEAAAFFALARADSMSAEPLGYVRGFGATSDAVHVTAPDRTGGGLARAAELALADAGESPTAIDLVSAHATATPYNDRAESLALRVVLGERAPSVVVHPFKAVVGHTLGASAALELAAAFDAMKNGVLPAALGEGPLDVECPVRVLEVNESGTPRTSLKLSAAFGGANAAIVASLDVGSGEPLSPASVSVLSIGEPCRALDVATVVARARVPETYLTRMDPLSSIAVQAAANALAGAPDLRLGRTGVVVGTSTATIENNEAFDLRLRERGARGVEPRRFPATSPNLPAGQCSIVFGLRGPTLSVGGGHGAAVEAILVAYDLLSAGDAEAIVVVAADDVGAVVSDLWAAAGWRPPAAGGAAVVLRRGGSPAIRRGPLAEALRRASRFGDGDGQSGWPSLLENLREFRLP